VRGRDGSTSNVSHWQLCPGICACVTSYFTSHSRCSLAHSLLTCTFLCCRGGGCELLNGVKQCYMEDAQGRELCPKHITLEYLENGPPEYAQVRLHYCVLLHVLRIAAVVAAPRLVYCIVMCLADRSFVRARAVPARVRGPLLLHDAVPGGERRGEARQSMHCCNDSLLCRPHACHWKCTLHDAARVAAAAAGPVGHPRHRGLPHAAELRQLPTKAVRRGSARHSRHCVGQRIACVWFDCACGVVSCHVVSAVIPKKDFKWVEWTEKKRPLSACQAAAQRGEKGGFIPQLTIGLLTHEPRSFGDSMETYLKYGLFEMVDE